MNTIKPSKPTTRVKFSFCRCGAQFQVETRGQKSCPSCIEARAIAEANKPPVVCRHCGEARNDCRFRICPDCKAAKQAKEEAAKAAKKPRKCRTCGELSLTISMGICDPCREIKVERWEEERKRERLARYEAQRQARQEEEEQAHAPEPRAKKRNGDDEFVDWFSEQSEENQRIMLDSMKQLCWESGCEVPGIGRNPFPMSWDEAFERHQRRLEALTGALSSVGDLGTHKTAVVPTDDVVNLEQVDHADQGGIDAAFRDLLGGMDF